MTAHLMDRLDTASRAHPCAGIVLLGDFNRLRDSALLSYPLKQVVKSPTRGTAVLDKIYTNLQDWYSCLSILPNIGRSDHNAVLMSATTNAKLSHGEVVTVTVRSNDLNGKAMLAQAIKNLDWNHLYQLPNCSDMVTCFYSTLTALIDAHLPLLSFKRHTMDKPWVTDQFRRLIRCRQNAWKNGQMERYRAYRNKINRLAPQLRRKYYSRKVRGLREGDPHNWWRSIKQITSFQSKSAHPLLGLANQLHDGDILALANNISLFFKHVADDLPPLSTDFTPPIPDHYHSEFIIDRGEVEMKLSRIHIHKAPGPDGLPNWVLRDFCDKLSGPVCAIFNASLHEGVVPPCWKEAHVIPVPKVHPPKAIESDL